LARCAFGQCVLGVQCTGTVSCPALPPECGAGKVPTIQGDCYGPCIPATECPAVSGCLVCFAPIQMCVYEYGAAGVEHCAATPAACGNQPNCSCARELCGGIEPCQDIADGIRCGLG